MLTGGSSYSSRSSNIITIPRRRSSRHSIIIFLTSSTAASFCCCLLLTLSCWSLTHCCCCAGGFVVRRATTAGFAAASTATTARTRHRPLGPAASLGRAFAATSLLRPSSSFRSRRSHLVGAARISSTNMAASTTNSNDNDNKQRLLLFDFDGVVCDSCDECTVSALRTCRKLGVLPKNDHLDDHDDDDDDDNTSNEYTAPQWLLDKMREIRPAIEVGWQIPVLLSVFLEQQQRMSVEDIITNYEQLVKEWLQKYNLTDKEMIEAFGNVRDAWIEDDINSWLNINKFYPGVPQALSNCNGKAVLVTTKQQRFATALCRHAGVDSAALPDDDIYGLGMYSKKSDVIVDRMMMMQGGGSKDDHDEYYKPSNTLFFEDRWPTLAKCLKDERLDGVQLYLACWGYVTPEELALAEAEPRVKVIALDEFSNIVSGE